VNIKHIFLPLGAIIALVVLSACTMGEPVTSICHATGDPASPYEEVQVDATTLLDHQDHDNDFWPVPNDGCPTVPVTVDNDGKITICHATSSENNPYNEITISRNGLNGHGKHEGDIIPAPAGGCPSERQ
jgi:hypothetical protein